QERRQKKSRLCKLTDTYINTVDIQRKKQINIDEITFENLSISDDECKKTKPLNVVTPPKNWSDTEVTVRRRKLNRKKRYRRKRKKLTSTKRRISPLDRLIQKMKKKLVISTH